MKLTKAELKQIIKEEISETSWFDEKINPLKEVYDGLRMLADGLDDLRERVKNLEGRLQ
tara:strand:+ start:354 stop:530 length:177 start_codon:yes stop_codon:yes gene_type:complete